MTDQDREAFQDWADDQFGGPAGRHTSRCDGVYLNGSVQAAWVGWQACAAHYAPKLTQQEVVHQVARAIHNACAELKKPYPTAIPCYSMNKNKAGWEVIAKAALRAAGIQFKEEASSNPEPGASP